MAAKPTIAMDSGTTLKSLFNATAFIKKTQLFTYDKSNIYSKSSNIFTCMYTQSMIKSRVTPIKKSYLYIWACHVIVLRISLVISSLGFWGEQA